MKFFKKTHTYKGTMEGEQLRVMDPCDALFITMSILKFVSGRNTFCDFMNMSQTKNAVLENKKRYIQK